MMKKISKKMLDDYGNKIGKAKNEEEKSAIYKDMFDELITVIMYRFFDMKPNKSCEIAIKIFDALKDDMFTPAAAEWIKSELDKEYEEALKK